MYLMHSNVPLRYLLGTYYYLNGFLLLHDLYRVYRGFKEGLKSSIFAISALFWAVLASYEGPIVSYAFRCFPEVLKRYWHVFQLFWKF